MPDVKLFSGTKSRYLAERISDYYGYPLGDITVKTFADGEMKVVINESVRRSYTFFIAFTFGTDDNIMMLLLMINSA